MTKLEKRNEVWGGMKSIMDKAASDNNRALTAEEAVKYDELEKEIQTLDHDLEREVRYQALETKITTPVEKRVVASATKGEKATLESEEYRSAFLNYCRTGEDSEIRSLYESPTEGGYAVPVILDKVLVTTLLAQNVMRNIGAKVIATTSTHDIPLLSTSATVSNTGEYPTGSSPIPAGDPAFNKVTLHAYKLAGLIQVSNELLFDSGVDLEGYIAEELGTVLANQEEYNFLTGSGVGMPTGIFNITNVGGNSVGSTPISGSVTGSLLLDAVLGVFYSMKPQHRKAAVWVVGDALVSNMRKAKDNYGRYLWDQSVVEGQPDLFNGVPVYVSSAGPTSFVEGATVGALVDPRYVTIGDRGATTFQRLNERFADQDQVGFKITKRSDIQVTKADALKLIVAG